MLATHQVLLEEEVLRIGQPPLSITVSDLTVATTVSHPSSKRPLHSSPASSSSSSSPPSRSASTEHTNKRADTRPEAASERHPEQATLSSSLASSLPSSASHTEPQTETTTVTENMHENERDNAGVSGLVEMDTVEEEERIEATTVVLVHRRVHSSSSSNSHHQHQHQHHSHVHSQGGLKLFRMQAVGLPLLESLPSRIHPRALYEAVERRVRGCFKTSILDLQRRNNSGMPDHHSHQDRDHDPSSSSSTHKVRPIATEDAVGGDIPPFGFVLRLVKLNGDCCSRCHWLNRCEGCLIPYSPSTSTGSSGSGATSTSNSDELIELSDLQSIAIDWHYIVYHEALEVFPPSDSGRLAPSAVTHSSVSLHTQHQSQALPLQKCLQKFTEEEVLDDMVCPTCKHSDGCLRRSFALWRLPPVLIIQLKRFQFNAYSRRKLTNRVDFPFEGLDLSCYLAPSHELSEHFKQYQEQQLEERVLTETTSSGTSSGPMQTAGGDCALVTEEETQESQERQGSPESSVELTAGTVYDLYSTVHHVGALGGGHYVASARDDFDPLQQRLLLSPDTPSSSSSSRLSQSKKGEGERQVGEGGVDNDSGTSQSQGDDGVCSVVEDDEQQQVLVAGGESSSGGGSGQEWFCYNDSVVSPTTPKEVAAGSSAYLLFYLRRDIRTASVTALHCPATSDTDDSDSGADNETDMDASPANDSGSKSRSTQKGKGRLNSRGQSQSSESGEAGGLAGPHTRSPGTCSRDKDSNRHRARSLPGPPSSSATNRFDVNFQDVDELTESDNAQCRVS